MSDAKPFTFADFVPGFDFLKNLTASSASVGAPGLPGLAKWIAPTLSVEEVDKRIQELKTVQFWLEQNLTALKATIQALEVQKMTLSTLRGMNLRMEDLASSFTRAANVASTAAASSSPAPAPTPAPAPAPAPVAPPPPPEPEVEEEAEPEASSAADEKGKAAGVVDPLQWWGALTQQFEQIASSALRDAASLRMPSTLQSAVEQASDVVKKTVAATGAKKPAAKKKAPAKKAAAKRASATAKRAAPRKR